MYYLASVANKVIINPQGNISWHGLASQPVFFKDLLDKLGIDVQVFKVGTYKSAVEPFIATEMSPANREQVTVFLNSIWNQLLDDVSVSRNISKDSLNAYADQCMDLCQAEEYIKCGLADSVLYKDEMIAYLKQLTGRKEDQSLNSLFLEDMINVKKNVPKDKSGNVVAVYYASGEILDAASSNSTEEVIDGQKMTRDLRRLRDDNNVKAVVLRVNSPGGSAYASEQIWREVVRLKEKETGYRLYGRLCSIRRLLHLLRRRFYLCRSDNSNRLHRYLRNDSFGREVIQRQTRAGFRCSKN